MSVQIIRVRDDQVAVFLLNRSQGWLLGCLTSERQTEPQPIHFFSVFAARAPFTGGADQASSANGD
jgi:hypothetical protein